jgi:DNA mismatch repair protein MutS
VTKTAEQQQPKLTPMMTQYMAIKDAHPDALLFYRMGDFYEMFFDDAVTASKVLDIALTKRGKSDDTDIPMCGVPWHSHESYLARLIKAGHRVAICDQTETPDQAKARVKSQGLPASKALVNRDVVRIVTAGTITEDHLLEANSANYLACLTQKGLKFGVSWLDLSTGEFYAQSTDEKSLGGVLERIAPNEILVSDAIIQNPNLFEIFIPWDKAITCQGNSLFEAQNAQSHLRTLFNIEDLDVFGSFETQALTAAGALIDYATRTQKGELPHIRPLQSVMNGDVMEIDAATRRNLEITSTLTGEKKGSLLSVIDRTVTAAGGRALSSRLSSPSTNIDEINNRLSMIDCLYNHQDIQENLSNTLKQVPDMERALSRLTVGRGGPRDLNAIKIGLQQAESIRGTLLAHQNTLEPLSDVAENLVFNHDETNLLDRLNRAVNDELPFLARDGGFIATGYAPHLDEQRALRTDSKQIMATMQADYANKTGVSTLKITHNNVLGYFIEVTAKHADKLMVHGNDNDALASDNPFVHRQTLANVVRFTTPELSTLESKIAKASDTAQAIEMEIFNQLVADVSGLVDGIVTKALALANLDVACSMTVLAVENHYTRPSLTTDYDFNIVDGRHPVVEHALTKEHKSFAPNNCALENADQLWLLTGPNMAGKSTFLRQNALITIMAQCGSYVPAKSATIGVVDKVFSRVGASDDLARGRSTFMVEMVETAAILNQSTERSLVILDEIGRGTATFDGLSIAWATLEFLHDKIKCRGLFATHYHELTRLTTTLDRLSPHAMAVKEWKGEIVFLHEVIKGAADQSYGVHVAKLAGIPAPVIKRSRQVLDLLQASETSGTLAKLADDLPLFSSVVESADNEAAVEADNQLRDAVDAIDPDSLTPREALDLIYQLKNIST